MVIAEPGRNGGRPLRTVVATLGVAALGALGLSACTVGDVGGGQEQEKQVHDPVFSVEEGAEGVSVIDPVSVTLEGDPLESVTMTNEAGKEVQGELSADRSSWRSAEPLGYGRTYSVTAKAHGKTEERSFTTVSPDRTAEATVSPAEGAVVGVGQTIWIRFDTTIYDRQAAQDSIEVITEPQTEGAFYWLSNTEVRWRPAEYWRPGTKVTVTYDAYGNQLGGGTYGGDTKETHFEIGDEMIATADDSTKTMTVERNGETIMSMPISMGSSRWPTPNGTYIVGDQRESMVMDSATFGLAYDKGGYRTKVSYATQMSWSGIYVHAAPWSVWAQGSQNVSHGCINVTTANAQWFMENTKRGDIVQVKNTIGETLSGADGLGDWNIPWETWKAGNVADAPS